MGNVAYKIFIDWDDNGSYTEETSYLIRASGSWSFSPPEAIEGASGIVPYCTIVLSNKTDRFSPMNSSSAIYSDIAGGEFYHRPMYIETSVDGGAYTRIFTGVLKFPEWQPTANSQFPVVSFDCRGIEEPFLNEKFKTTQTDFVDWFDSGITESQLIEEWLTSLGLTLSDWDLDPGLFSIPYARLNDSSIIEACWKLAASCGGRFYTGPDGKFRYENMMHWLSAPHTTSQETLDYSSWTHFATRLDDKDLWGKIIVKYGRGTLLAEDTIYEQDGAFIVAPGETRTFTIKLNGSLYSLTSITYTITTSGGTDLSSDVTVTPVYYSESVEIEVENTHASKAAELRKVTLVGRLVKYTSDEQFEVSSQQSFWTDRSLRTRTVSDSTFIQSLAHAEFIGNFLINRQEIPRFTYSIQGVNGSVTRKLGDRVTVNPTGFVSSSRQGFIIGIDWSIDHQGFTQDLTVLDREGLFPYEDTSPGYFIICTSELGSADPQRGRLFY